MEEKIQPVEKKDEAIDKSENSKEATESQINMVFKTPEKSV